MKKQEIEMCQGSLWKNLWLYSIPLMFSNVLQILFNLSDVAVVGKFAGPTALGAVGSTTILITLTTGLLQGMSAGVNSVVALFLGGQKKAEVKKAVHTAFLLCLFLGILVLAAGLLFASPVLLLMNTKEELMEGAVLYLTIYLLGSPALAMYNYGNAILSAVGDTKRPLKYLSISGVMNIILNLVFVIVFHLSVMGVALASIISQYVSAALILNHLRRVEGDCRLNLAELRCDGRTAGRILRIGIPSAIQYSLFAIANLFVQTAVNYFDHVVVEGNSAAANADSIVYDMMAAFYTACTSFIAQNMGAGKKDRILKTFGITTLYSFLVGAGLGGLLVLFRVPFLLLFTSDAQVLSYGMIRLTIMGLSYGISAFMDNATAASRGIGKSTMPTVIVILGSVVFRIIWIYTVFAYFHTLESLYLLYACAWTVTAICGNLYFLVNYRKLPEEGTV